VETVGRKRKQALKAADAPAQPTRHSTRVTIAPSALPAKTQARTTRHSGSTVSVAELTSSALERTQATPGMAQIIVEHLMGEDAPDFVKGDTVETILERVADVPFKPDQRVPADIIALEASGTQIEYVTEAGTVAVKDQPKGYFRAKVERFQYLVEQQPDCMDMDGDAVHGRWFWPIDHAWIFGEPDKPQGWTTSLLSIVAIRLRSMILSDHVRLITGICDNPQPAGCYVNYADWIRMWNKSYGFCPFCNRDIWIGFDEECNDEDVPPEGQKATIQRLKNSIIHLRSNCHATLICLTL